MAIVITYDVPNKHKELKDTLFGKGYSATFKHNGNTFYLPNTTVYHADKTSQEAFNEINAICTSLKISLDRCIAVQMDSWWAAYGEPF